MAEGNKMREMSVNKLMVQMGIPMILSMALQAVYNIVDSAFVGNMLRIIESCVVKMENREIKKGDRIDDQRRKFALSETVPL